MCIVNSTLRASYTHFVRSSHCCRGCARTMRMCVDNPVKDARMPHAAHKRMSRAFAFEGATVYLDLTTASCSERTANLRAARYAIQGVKTFRIERKAMIVMRSTVVAAATTTQQIRCWKILFAKKIAYSCVNAFLFSCPSLLLSPFALHSTPNWTSID